MIEKPELETVDTETTDANSLDERISRRAYELYESRGREDGHDLQDWVQAEQQVLDELEQPTRSPAVRRKEKGA